MDYRPFLEDGDSYKDIVTFLSKCLGALITCSVTFGSPKLAVSHGHIPPPFLPQGGFFDINPRSDDADDEIRNHVIQLRNKLGNPDDLDSDGSEGGSVNAIGDKESFIRLNGLRELTLKKICNIRPLLLKLIFPSLQRFILMVLKNNEPEPYLGPTLINFLDHSSPSALDISSRNNVIHEITRLHSTTNSPPLKYLTLSSRTHIFAK